MQNQSFLSYRSYKKLALFREGGWFHIKNCCCVCLAGDTWPRVFHSYKTIDVIILVLVGFVDVSLNNLLARLRIRLRALLDIAQLVKIRPLSSIGKQFWSLSFYSPTNETLQAKRVQAWLNNQKYSYARGTKNFTRLANVYLFGMSIKRVLIKLSLLLKSIVRIGTTYSLRFTSSKMI